MTNKEALAWLQDRTKHGKGVTYLNAESRLTDFCSGEDPVEKFSAGIQDGKTVQVSGLCETMEEACRRVLKSWMAS